MKQSPHDGDQVFLFGKPMPLGQFDDLHREASGMLAKTIVILDRMPDAEIP